MFNILIKENSTNKYKLLQVKKEIMKEVATQVEDAEGNLIDQTELVGTNTFETVVFETEDKDELEAKCIELLATCSSSQILPIENLKFSLDMNWE